MDIKTIVKTGGKFFPAPTFASSASDSIELPHYRAKTVSGNYIALREFCNGHVTILTIGFTSYSEPQLESFRKPFIDEYVLSRKCQIIDIRPIMTRLKWLVFSFLLQSTATAIVPKQLQSSYTIAYRPMVLLDSLAIPNYLGAFVYLIDKNGKVRWRASGEATRIELETMHRIIKQLLQERNPIK